MEQKTRVAAKGIIQKEGKILLISRSEKEKFNPNELDFPGGKLEFGESPKQGLKREIEEETGLEVEIVKPTSSWSFMFDENTQIVGTTFYCKYKSGDVKLSDEHTHHTWVTPEEILEGDYPDWMQQRVTDAMDALSKQ